MDNIARIDGRDAFAYFGEKPWHEKGTEVPGLMTVAEGIVAGGLDWEVVKTPLILNDMQTPCPGMYATVRLGPDIDQYGELVKHPLAAVGEKYRTIQNREVFSFFDSALGDGAACLETVGALGNGERVFALARLPEVEEITADDPITRYICLTATHDGKGCVEGFPTDVRVVCQNTLQVAIGAAKRRVTGRVKIKHTASFKAKMEQAHEVMCANRQYWEKAREAFKALAMRDMSRLDVIAFLERVFPGKRVKDPETGAEVEKLSGKTRNNRDAVLALFDGEAQGADKVGRSAWAMFNAFTEWSDHHRAVQQRTDRWESAQFGTGADARQKAFDILMSMV